MSQKFKESDWKIQQKQQLIYSLEREIIRNDAENQSLRFKIEIYQDEIKELQKK